MGREERWTWGSQGKGLELSEGGIEGSALYINDDL